MSARQEHFVQPAAIEAAAARAADRGQSAIKAMLIARGDQVVYESYFDTDEKALFDLRSATKSITGLLFGIALASGEIASLDMPVSAFFSDYVETPQRRAVFDAITLRHLLQMRSGLSISDWDATSPGHEDKMYATANWLKFFFAQRKVAEPGAQFSYCTACVVVLGEVIARAAKQPLDQFAAKRLFAPLGITSAQWQMAPLGLVDAGGHLRMTAGDFLRIGQLMLAKGRWQDKQVVLRDWIEASLSVTSPASVQTNGAAFGLLWWLQPVVDGEVRSFQARGNGGQYLIAVPSLNLVAAFTGTAFNNPTQLLPFVLMQEHIIPAIQAR
ncbi:MAG: serine hydrolase domain-containing protein [Burkholderiaceae bacterium]